MSFALEREMTPVVENWLASQQLLVKGQFETPWGVCDLVGCSLDPDRVRTRFVLGQRKAIGSHLRVSVLLSLPDEHSQRGATTAGLRRLFSHYVTEQDIERELHCLVAHRFVHVTHTGSFQRKNGWMPLHNRLVAVELKLHRVKEALHQAIANQAFADESIVALPLHLAQKLTESGRISDFRTVGVGLLAVSPNGCSLLEPAQRSRRVAHTTQVRAVEKFWGSIKHS